MRISIPRRQTKCNFREGKQMSKINEYEAPEGYIAVEPEQYYHFGGECKGCCFLGNYVCLSEEAICCAECREDGRDVIFKPVLH
jgi:hypothetical protein